MTEIHSIRRWIVTLFLLLPFFFTGEAANYLCFTAGKAGSKVWYTNGGTNKPDVQYSEDGSTWKTWNVGDTIPLAKKGDKIYIRGNNPTGFSHDEGLSSVTDIKEIDCTYFGMSGSIAATGSVMSLIDGEGTSTTIPDGKGCFSHLFYRCSALTRAPELPATKLAEACYCEMFHFCSNITEAPELPATELAQHCYLNMFSSCTKLSKTPKLPATKLAQGCYKGMFAYTALKEAPELPVTKLEPSCYKGMFRSVKTLTKAPKLPATELTSNCYNDMFTGCTSLTQAPELPASELKYQCYYQMFNGCTKLNYIKVGLMSLDNTIYATGHWVAGVNSPGVFIFPCGSKYNEHGESAVPDSFTIVASPIVIFQNPDGKELWRDTTDCRQTPVYKGPDPYYVEGAVFKNWDKELVAHATPDLYYYTAVYELPPAPPANCLCFTVESEEASLYIANVGGNSPDVRYSINGGTWEQLGSRDNVFLEKGDKIYFKGNNPQGFSSGETVYTSFGMDGEFSASGSVMSLIDGEGELLEIPNDSCFIYLFADCKGLISAPELPATTLKKYCYGNMFEGCSDLKEAPALPATTIEMGCYKFMFRRCESLVKAPELPARKMESECYMGMFLECSSLAQMPDLPSVDLAESCYERMFHSCTSLTEVPMLPASTLEPYCYAHMFIGCSSLNYIEVDLLTLDNEVDATLEWVSGVQAPGVFVFRCGSKYNKYGKSQVPNGFDIIASPIVIFLNPDSTELWRDTTDCTTVPVYKGPDPTYGEGDVFTGWDKELEAHATPDVYYYMAQYDRQDPPEQGNWLCFTAMEADSRVTYLHTGANSPDVWYSINGGKDWQQMAEDEIVALENVGDKIYFKGNNPTGFSHGDLEGTYNQYTHFVMTGKIAASGSVMSLIDGKGFSTEIPNDFCFSHLFASCTSLVQAPELPATKLTAGCYENMFQGCNGLEVAPELPSTTLADRCYFGMFMNCNNLIQAPELPAEEMRPYCYSDMFAQCLKLENAPVLRSTSLDTGCYCAMFQDCHALVVAPELPATVLAEYCYNMMFNRCISLTQVPVLPATEMEKECYSGMFSFCESLVTPPSLPSNSLAYGCYREMFRDCGSLSTAPELPSTTLDTMCYMKMFENCTALTKAPELPATSLTGLSYYNMFRGCKSLNYMKVGVISLDNECSATVNWVEGVDGPGVFIFPCGSTYDKHGNSEVPMDFEIIGRIYTINATITAEGSYTWNGITYTESTSWTDSLQTTFGCDSVINYHLEITGGTTIPATFTDKDTSACDVLVFKDAVYMRDASWNDTLQSANGGDSILVYHLTIHKSVVTGENISAEGSYTWKGITFTESASWNDTLQTAFGCDSIVQYHLEIKEVAPIPATVTDIPLTACDSFLFEGVTYRESAEWNDTLLSVNGADSILAYHLTIHKSVVTEENISAEGSYTWKDLTFTEDASWNDTLQTTFGCDSIVMYRLEIKEVTPTPTTITDIPLTACDSLVFEGVTYRESAEWNDTLPAANGGDSILAYHLTLHKSVVTEENISAEGSYTWKEFTFTEDASWSDTLQTAFGCDSIIFYNLKIEEVTIPNPATVTDIPLTACDSFVFEGVTFRESGEWNDTLPGANGGDSILAYHLTIHKSVVAGESLTAKDSYTWKDVTYTEDASWNDTLQTAFGCDSIVRYHLTIEKEKPDLQLTVNDNLYIVLPGGSETISYELTGGEGSKYEVRHNGQAICSGNVANDSTVSLNCPSNLEPGAYNATLEMCDDEGNCAEKDFTFNVMRPDDKQKSFYVKVWNDVVICRNADGQFQSYQWYKDRKKCGDASRQYFNDVALLDGEYMVFVKETSGKSYFIEPVTYAPVEAAYAITAEPNVVARNTDFTLTVTGVDEEELSHARIVVYRADGVVEKIVDEVEAQSTMRLKAGEYVIVLTVRDGKNANCKVLSR